MVNIKLYHRKTERIPSIYDKKTETRFVSVNVLGVRCPEKDFKTALNNFNAVLELFLRENPQEILKKGDWLESPKNTRLYRGDEVVLKYGVGKRFAQWVTEKISEEE